MRFSLVYLNLQSVLPERCLVSCAESRYIGTNAS